MEDYVCSVCKRREKLVYLRFLNPVHCYSLKGGGQIFSKDQVFQFLKSEKILVAFGMYKLNPDAKEGVDYELVTLSPVVKD